MTPAILGCPTVMPDSDASEAPHADAGAKATKGRRAGGAAAIDSRKDLTWKTPPPVTSTADDAAEAARSVARAAVARSRQPPPGKEVEREREPDKSAAEAVGRLESKVADLQHRLKQQTAIATSAAAAAAKATAAAETEATRNQVDAFRMRARDSGEFSRDLEASMASAPAALRVACRQSSVRMRVVAAEAAHDLATLNAEMLQDEHEDRREAEHAELIAAAPGAVQRLVSASRQV